MSKSALNPALLVGCRRPLKFYVPDYIRAVAEPFAVLLGCRLIHADVSAHNQFFKSILTSYELGCHGLAELDVRAFKDEMY